MEVLQGVSVCPDHIEVWHTQSRPPPTCMEAYRPLRGPLLLLFHPMSLRAGRPPPATRHTDLCVALFYCYFTPCHSEQAAPHLLRGIQTSAWPSFTIISPHVTQSRPPPPPATRHTDLCVALFYCYFTPCHSEQATPHLLRGIQTSMWPYFTPCHSEQVAPHLLRGIQTSAWPSFTVISPHVTQSRPPPTCYEAYRPLRGPLLLLFHPMSLRAGRPPHLLRGIQTSAWPSFTVISPHVTQSRPPPTCYEAYRPPCGPILPHVTQSRSPPTCYEAYRPLRGPLLLLFHPMSLRAGRPPPATRHTDLCVALFYYYFTPCHSEQAAPPTCYEAYRPLRGPLLLLFHPMSLREAPPHLLRGIQTSMWPSFTPCHSEQVAPHLLRGIQTSAWPSFTVISPHVTQSRPPPTCYEAYRPPRGPLLLLFHPMSLRAGHPPPATRHTDLCVALFYCYFTPCHSRAGHPPPATRHTDLCVALFYCYFTPCHSEQATPHLLLGIQTSAWPSFTVISPNVTQSRPPPTCYEAYRPLRGPLLLLFHPMSLRAGHPHLLRGIQTSAWPSFTVISPHVTQSRPPPTCY